MDLQTLWYLIIGLFLAAYVIMDGYDLGIGILSLFTPRNKHEHRAQLIEIIGPHWDGNEVLLIVFGGMLFAVFPRVYALLLSGLYLPFIFLLLLFIVRGISIPLRSRYDTERWRNFWDLCFGISSFAIAFLLGAVTANLIRGITINENGVLKLNLIKLTRPFSLWMGFFSAALLCAHGAIYTGRKSGEDLKSFCRKAGVISWLSMLVFAVPTGIIVLTNDPSGIFKKNFLLFSLFLLLLIGAVVYIPWGLKTGRFNETFAASTIATGCFLALFYLYSYPNLLRTTEEAKNFTIYNSSASDPAMIVMLILTTITAPVIISYTIYAHLILNQSPDLEK